MKSKLTLIICLGCLTGRVYGDLIATTNSLPVDYTVAAPISYFGGLVVFSGFTVTSFSTNTLPPASIPGSFIDINYSATVTMSNVLNQFVAPVIATEKIVFSGETNGVSTYNTEMLQMDISGGNLPANVMLRESPTLASTGQTTISFRGSSNYQIHGFFNLNTELSFNGGANWIPNDGAPANLVIAPEPAPMALFGLGLAGFACLRRRKKSF